MNNRAGPKQPPSDPGGDVDGSQFGRPTSHLRGKPQVVGRPMGPWSFSACQVGRPCKLQPLSQWEIISGVQPWPPGPFPDVVLPGTEHHPRLWGLAGSVISRTSPHQTRRVAAGWAHMFAGVRSSGQCHPGWCHIAVPATQAGQVGRAEGQEGWGVLTGAWSHWLGATRALALPHSLACPPRTEKWHLLLKPLCPWKNAEKVKIHFLLL